MTTGSIRRGRAAASLRALVRCAPAGLVYAGLLIAVGAVLATRTAATRQSWLDWSSTSLANLHTHPVGSMVISALVTESDLLAWTALGVVGLASAASGLGNLRAAVLVLVGHVGATLVSEGLLAQRIARGAAPVTDRTLLDIGPSYVVVGALVAGILYGRWPARVASAIGFAVLSPYLFGGLTRLEVAPVGHCWSMVSAAAFGWWLRRTRRAHRAPAMAISSAAPKPSR